MKSEKPRRGGRRPGAGRPAKPKATKQRYRVMVNLTAKELAALDAAAGRSGDSLGGYVRAVLLRSLGLRRR